VAREEGIVKITEQTGECDCLTNGCEPRIDVSVRRDGVHIEVHGMDDNPGNAAEVARGMAGLVEALYEAAEAER